MQRKSLVRFPILGLSILTIFALLLTACGGTPISEDDKKNQQPVKGGTWVVNMSGAPASLIPTRSSTIYSVMPVQTVFAAMLYSNLDGTFSPGLLEEVPSLDNGGISADYKTWKLKFKSGLKWSDGEPLTAEDFDFFWKLNQNPDFSASATSGFEDIESSELSSDKLELTLTLKRANATFLASVLVDVGPIAKHFYEKMEPAEFANSPENHKPSVVSGPFKVATSEPGKRYELVPNENWFMKDQGPHLDKIIYETGVQGSTILQKARAGDINSTYNIDPLLAEDYRSLPNYEVVVPPAGGFEGLFFNLKHPALKDVSVRKAIAMSIDREVWTERARKGIGKPSCLVVPSTILSGYVEESHAACTKYDIEGAKKLLDDNGWKVVDNVRQKDGVKLEVPLITNQFEWRKQSLLFIQSQLNQLNIKTDIKTYESGAYFDEILPNGKPEEYGIAEFGFSLSFDPDPSGLSSCTQVPTEANGLQGQNYSFYCNEKLEPLLTKQLSEVDTEKRKAIFKDIHKIFLDDMPFLGLSETSLAGVYKKTTGRNYNPAPMGSYEVSKVWTWWCAGGKC